MALVNYNGAGRALEDCQKERDRLQSAIDEFCVAQNWAAESWKSQPHVMKLYRLSKSDFGSRWNQRTDELGARRGTVEDLKKI